MGIYESGVRTVWRGLMRVAEHRIGSAAELGTPLKQAVDSSPVLLVHGYGNDASSMRAVQRSLARDGFDVFTIDLPNFGYGDAMADAAIVKAKVAAILASTGAKQVDLVGHSRGGLVARASRQLLDPDGSIGRVVTVSSANQGIHLGPFDRIGAIGLPEGMQQIRRGTQLIEDTRRTRPRRGRHERDRRRARAGIGIAHRGRAVPCCGRGTHDRSDVTDRPLGDAARRSRVRGNSRRAAAASGRRRLTTTMRERGRAARDATSSG